MNAIIKCILNINNILFGKVVYLLSIDKSAYGKKQVLSRCRKLVYIPIYVYIMSKFFLGCGMKWGLCRLIRINRIDRSQNKHSYNAFLHKIVACLYIRAYLCIVNMRITAAERSGKDCNF